MKRFENKVVFITGAADGIGRVTAIEFAKEGAVLVLCDRNAEKGQTALETVVSEGASKNSQFFQCDVSSEEQVTRLFDEIQKCYGCPDIAVNNAGVEGALAPLVDQKVSEFDRVFAINVKGTFLCLQSELKLMQDKGSGVVVNVISIAAHVGFPNSSIYTASKHALAGLTKAAALENAAKGIRVCAVSPGAVDTEMTDRFTGGDEQTKKSMIEGIPIRRLCRPAEIARGILFLASDDASLLVGQTLNLDGGWANVKP